MRRFVICVLSVWALAIGLVGCGGTSFLGLNDRQAYILLTPLSIEKVKLASGAVVGTAVPLNAPNGIRSICFRSASGQLYGMGGDKMVYRINAASGLCTVVSPGTLGISDALGTLYSAADGSKLYYVASDNTTYSINPDNGTLATTGTPVAYAAGDPNVNPTVGGVSFSAAGGQIFFLDPANDVLSKLDTPLGGVLHTVGPLGVNVAGSSGLAIDPQLGKGYFTCDTGSPGLYRVDLATGAATLIAGPAVGGGGIAIIP